VPDPEEEPQQRHRVVQLRARHVHLPDATDDTRPHGSQPRRVQRHEVVLLGDLYESGRTDGTPQCCHLVDGERGRRLGQDRYAAVHAVDDELRP
jgi:hypothetical protein